MQKEFGLERKAARHGMRPSQNDMCRFFISIYTLVANAILSRTYGENIGEDIREGYEPADESAMVDPEDIEENNPFAIGDGNDEQENSDESQHWNQSKEPEVFLQPKYGLEGEAFENVWGGGEPSGSASENP